MRAGTMAIAFGEEGVRHETQDFDQAEGEAVAEISRLMVLGGVHDLSHRRFQLGVKMSAALCTRGPLREAHAVTSSC